MVEAFITSWRDASVGERSHCQSFIIQLCRVLGVPAPDEVQPGDLDYAFERPVQFRHDDGAVSLRRMDCYRRGAFVLEAKQSGQRPSADRPAAVRLMRSAKLQAELYARALDEPPPFLIVVDVGRAIELWADFSLKGRAYAPFPDRNRHRIRLEDLASPQVRDLLAKVWLDPMSLDPAREAAEVTLDIAGLLAGVSRGLERRPPPDAGDDWPGQVAQFLTQCVFAMFADSVGLIAENGFRRLIESYRGKAQDFHKGAADFFARMDEGGHCAAIQQDIRRFNGGLFRDRVVCAVGEAELELLAACARRDWSAVEPAIFGAVLEQALDPAERARLGAHYTPRAFVETLVLPALIEPLREAWDGVEAQAIGHYLKGQPARAQRLVRDFHRRLCTVRVLDPACGTGNFLYVAMAHMKALEGEVVNVLAELGDPQPSLRFDRHAVSPEQFLGLERNARAAPIAELVMWIGHLQWHFRTFGAVMPSEPILRNFGAIRQTDALLTWDREEPVRDPAGAPLVDGQGRPRRRLVNPRPTTWPQAEFIIGNPPFLGAKDQRRELGEDYVDALWSVRHGRFRSADLCMIWSDRAAELLAKPNSGLERFGFITTNSITQTLNRRVVEAHLAGGDLRLVFAAPDHPWVKGAGRAQVRIAMTVAERGAPETPGRLARVTDAAGLNDDQPEVRLDFSFGVIGADLSLDPAGDLTPLAANAGLAHRGMQLVGRGFVVDRGQIAVFGAEAEGVVRPLVNGRDLAERTRGLEVIDLWPREEAEVRRTRPHLYQHLLRHVKPERDRNNRAVYRRRWWLFGEPRPDLRAALGGMRRYIATVETAKHRWFRFVDAEVAPDNKLIVIASDDAALLALLNSRPHRAWFLRHAGRIGVFADEAVYAKSVCFDAFPFPVLDAGSRRALADAGEELDTLRATVLAQDPELTMTGLYNVLAALEQGCGLTAWQESVRARGCVDLLRQLHRQINRLSLLAYGWPEDIADAEIVARLRALHRVRRAQEAAGEIQDLFGAPLRASRTTVSEGLAAESRRGHATPAPRPPAALASALLAELRQAGRPVEPSALARRFTPSGPRLVARIEDTLSVLAAAGAAARTDAGWFAPRRGL